MENQTQQETETNEIHWIIRDLQKSGMSTNFKIWRKEKPLDVLR